MAKNIESKNLDKLNNYSNEEHVFSFTILIY